MANVNLASAKKTKNDEFYTQYADIQKEVEAYLEYDKETFKNKVVYCNCDDPFESNFFRYFVLNFNRLGLKQLITTSYKPSPVANTQIGLFGDDVTLAPAKGRAKITANKFVINDVGDTDNDGQFNLSDIAEQLKANKHNEWEPLEGTGDFRSAECVELLKQADIVVTNPPFSLFREYVKQLIDYNKKFLIIGNIGAVSYKEIFPLIKDNKVWLGVTGYMNDMVFAVPEGTEVPQAYKEKAERLGYKGNYTRLGNSCWFTNLDHGRRHQEMQLMTTADNLKFNKKLQGKSAYDHYDNYDAIEVPVTNAIPSDYSGVMGVPISFLDKFDPEQFQIIGITKPAIDPQLRTKIYGKQVQVDKNGKRSEVTKLNDGAVLEISEPSGNTYYIVDGKLYIQLYSRVLIQHRKAIK